MARAVITRCLLFAVALLSATGAIAEDRHGALAKGRPTQEARSIGSPTEGRLQGGVDLMASRELRLRHPSGARYGLPSLIALLERSARRLVERHPGATLFVGDLSLRQGGSISGHKSHESGRDADVAFLFVTADGQDVTPAELLTVRADGTALENRAWRFDDARNWSLVEAWVTDPAVRIEHIFVADHVRARLLRYARAKGSYLPTLHRAALAMKQPTRGMSHDDHFHVRIGCPPAQKGVCVRQPRDEQRVKRAGGAGGGRGTAPPIRQDIGPPNRQDGGLREVSYRAPDPRRPKARPALVKGKKARETTRR